jgi:hypothetical protein
VSCQEVFILSKTTFCSEHVAVRSQQETATGLELNGYIPGAFYADTYLKRRKILKFYSGCVELMKHSDNILL